MRQFKGSSGGQVEGCVCDEPNGWVLLGEEPFGLWRYGAEPDSHEGGTLVVRVGDGRFYGDVEGVTLVLGRGPNDGFIKVSCQGISAFNLLPSSATTLFRHDICPGGVMG